VVDLGLVKAKRLSQTGARRCLYYERRPAMGVFEAAGEHPDRKSAEVTSLDRAAVTSESRGPGGPFERAFLQLYRKPPTTESGSNVGGWLYRVATNLGYNALRGKRRRDAREVKSARELPPALPLDEVLAAEDRSEVRPS
jgi:hypothetical protein